MTCLSTPTNVAAELFHLPTTMLTSIRLQLGVADKELQLLTIGEKAISFVFRSRASVIDMSL